MKLSHLIAIAACLLLVTVSTQLTIPQSNVADVLLSAMVYSLIGFLAVVLFLCASILYEFAAVVRRRILHIQKPQIEQAQMVEPKIETKIETPRYIAGMPTAELITDPNVIRMIESAIA